MPRQRASMPAYRYHISGQARVTLDGKDFYLGEYDTPESRAKYFALLAEYSANGQRAPSDSVHLADAPKTVGCVTAEYRRIIDARHRRSHADRFRNLCTTLEDEYGDVPAVEFGPVKLAELRDLFVTSGNNRTYANAQVQSIRQIFRHAVSRELIPISVLESLKTLEPLRRGQTTASEPKERQPVPIEAVAKTIEHLSPTLAAMVRIQLATGMRPGEVCAMRPCDIDRSGPVWVYRPSDHKTAHHGISKAVPIVAAARKALTPLLLRDAEAYCFSPAESAQWYLDRRAAERQTPEKHGNRPGTNRKQNPKRTPGDRYNKDSYRRAITRAAKAAKAEHWTPYQLRYTAASHIQESLSLEAAQALLGHTTKLQTEHYARQNLTQASVVTPRGARSERSVIGKSARFISSRPWRVSSLFFMYLV
jgi:integrase